MGGNWFVCIVFNVIFVFGDSISARILCFTNVQSRNVRAKRTVDGINAIVSTTRSVLSDKKNVRLVT